jgi:hypothetical protein
MIEGPAHKRSVLVSGKPCEITVYRKSKSVWVASGEHNGRTFDVKRSSLTAAESAWAAGAEYHYHQN